MKLGKKSITSILVSIFLIASCVASLAGVFSAVFATYTILDNTYYTVEYEGHKFKCYLIDGETSVAIGWLTGDDNPVPSTLNVPETVTIEGTPHTVKAVVKGGFRYCDFDEIILPKTITEIREEAFAYCENLQSFIFPHGMTEIAPSTFLDCRSLTTLFYTGIKDGEQVRVLGNSTITSIGDHAFDSCINLSNFYCQSTVTYFGESCFQNCQSIAAFYFPSDNMHADETRNLITVESYAFSDCPSLEVVYFEENMHTIKPYAFSNAHPNLKFTYTGSVEPTYDAHWRDVNLTTSNNNVYPFLEMGQSKIIQSTEYPGLIYSVETDDVYLDSSVGGGKTTTVKVIANNTTPYIKINRFETPFATQEGYYDVGTNTLTIPNTIDGKTVKIIASNAFVNHSELQSVVFNQGLVQIQHWAFNGCTNIASLNFNACQSLKEISFEVFQKIGNTTMWQNEPPSSSQVYNTALNSITLPNCLEYIGDAAFYNFPMLEGGISFKTNPSQPASLKMIGDYAFAVFRNTTAYKNHDTLIDIELPNTLNDIYAAPANYYHPYQPWLNGEKNGACKTRLERTAIGRYVFDNADVIGTVTMEKNTTAQENDSTHKTSFASNVFVRCDNLVRFESNKKLYLIGADCFKNVTSLREIFLHTELSSDVNSPYDFPWGISDSYNTFQANPLSGVTDAVIYLSGSAAPKKLGDPDQYSTLGYMWNSEQSVTFPNEFQNNSDAGESNNRSHIPTFYNIDWDSGGDAVKYWQPGNTNSPTNTYLDGMPNSPADYKSGLVAIVKSDSSHYTVAKYFTDGNGARTNNTIDLTQLDIASSIDTIGEYAFAAANSNRGLYFVLPSSVTKIGDRAFYRKQSNGVRVVTYSTSNYANAVVPNSTQYPSADYSTLASIITKCGKSSGSGYPGYCYLPPSVTKIERDAFYNNTFTSVNLGANLSFLGSSAFLTYAWTGKIVDFSFTPAANSQFGYANGGVYYVGNANMKALLYQPSGNTGTFTVADGTKAIGFRAVANTNYTGVTLPTGLTTIYGGAFQKSASLATVSGAGLATLEYISARSETELFNSTARTLLELYDSNYNTLPFDYYDNSDFSGSRTDALNKIYNRAINSAFKGCTSLATIDFTSMTSLKKIGPEAFNGCSSLSNMANSAAYNFKKVNSDSTISDVDLNKTTGVLDLSQCAQLRVMDKLCFKDCSTINYAILPNTTGSNHTSESQFYFGKNPNDNFNTGTDKVFHNNTRVLFGETYYQVAYQRNVDFTKNHYPQGALNTSLFDSDFSKLKYFYRYHYEHTTGTTTIGGVTYDQNVIDYANIGGGSDTMMGYWDYYNGTYYLFVGPAGAQAYYNFREANQLIIKKTKVLLNLSWAHRGIDEKQEKIVNVKWG